MKIYYLHNGTEQEGPFDIEGLKNKNISNNSQIWYEGLPEWTTADKIEDLQELLNKTTPPPFKEKENIKPPPILKTESLKVNPATTPKKKSKTGLTILIIILIISVVLGGAYIYLINNGHNVESILNIPKKIDLKVICSNLENLIVSSSVDVTVSNSSGHDHRNVTIRVTAYDKKGNIVKQKETVFTRTLQSYGSLTKIVTLPAKAKTCDCIVLSSDTQ
ncbi:MAG: DUF4339 domain-containing protein [Bacteroidota bacterium]